MWKVREIADKVTNMVMNYSEAEAKVREATNDEAWGPTGPVMSDVAKYTFMYEQFSETMDMLWKRMLQDNLSNWRRTYKSLLLLTYLIRNGSERVVTSAREHVYDLRSLENYKFIDEFGKDQGINIRHKVKELIEFIQDDERLREERKKSRKNRDKYVGVSGNYGDTSYIGRTAVYDWDNSSCRDNRWNETGGTDFRPYSDSHDIDNNSVDDAYDCKSERVTRAERRDVTPPKVSEPQPNQVDLLSQDVTSGDSWSQAGKEDDFADFNSAPALEVPPTGTFGDFSEFQSAASDFGANNTIAPPKLHSHQSSLFSAENAPTATPSNVNLLAGLCQPPSGLGAPGPAPSRQTDLLGCLSPENVPSSAVSQPSLSDNNLLSSQMTTQQLGPTWSDVKGVDISLDSLCSSVPARRTHPPSMNELRLLQTSPTNTSSAMGVNSTKAAPNVFSYLQ